GSRAGTDGSQRANPKRCRLVKTPQASSHTPEAQGRFPNTGPCGPLSPFIRKATSESATGAGRCGWYRSDVTACYSLQGGVGSPSSLSNPERSSKGPLVRRETSMDDGSSAGTVVLVHGGFVDGSGWQGV